MINLRPVSSLFGSQLPRSTRPFYAPTLVNKAIPLAVAFEEDFFNAPFGPATVAGCPGWTVTVPAGTGYINQSGEDFQDDAQGIMRISAQGANGITILEESSGAGAAADQTAKQSFWNGSTCLWAFRFNLVGSLSLITNSIFGIGLPGTNNGVPNIGVDWATDPDTTLDAVATTAHGTGIVITRHAASYSGDPAGALMCRLYGWNASVAVNSKLQLAATVAAGTWHKVEIYKDVGTTFKIYYNGVYAGSLTSGVSGVIDTDVRACGIAKTIGGQIRTLQWDWYYQEIAGQFYTQR